MNRKRPSGSTRYPLCFLLFVCAACSRDTVRLSNGHCSLDVCLEGGAITEFTLDGAGPNPFTWSVPSDQMPRNNRKGAHYQGHFLCLGRWGAPTAGEIAAGIPDNGDIPNRRWRSQMGAGGRTACFRASSGPDGMELERHMILGKDAAIVRVTDRIRSTSSIGRLCNMVQHPTIGPPFLSEKTRINSNAGAGFLQANCYPDPGACEYVWPYARGDGGDAPIDLRRSDCQTDYVSTHLMPPGLAWVSALSPEYGLLLCYVWESDAYPWLNLWHQTRDGHPWAKGLEFGTTGIGKSYQELLDCDTRFHGTPSFFYLDAGEEIQRSFYCILTRIPDSCTDVCSIRHEDGQIINNLKNETRHESDGLDTDSLADRTLVFSTDF